MEAASGSIHLKNILHLDPHFFNQSSDLSFKSFSLHRFKFKKERFDNIRRDVHEKDAEEQEDSPHPQPPPPWAEANKKKGSRNQKHREHGGDDNGLHQIAQPEPTCHGVEAVAVLNAEILVEAEGDTEDGPSVHETQDKKHPPHDKGL